MVEITVCLLVCQDSFLPIKCQTSLNLMNHDCCKKHMPHRNTLLLLQATIEKQCSTHFVMILIFQNLAHRIKQQIPKLRILNLGGFLHQLNCCLFCEKRWNWKFRFIVSELVVGLKNLVKTREYKNSNSIADAYLYT